MLVAQQSSACHQQCAIQLTIALTNIWVLMIQSTDGLPEDALLGDLYQHATTHLKLPSYLTSCVGLQHSKQLLWGWYTLRYYPPDALLEAIAKRLTPLVHNMDARTLSEFIWAFGGLNYEPSNMQLFLQVRLSFPQQTLRHGFVVIAAPLSMLQGILTCLASSSYCMQFYSLMSTLCCSTLLSMP